MFLCFDFGSTSFKAALYKPSLELAGKGEAMLKYSAFGEHVELEIDQTRECFALAAGNAFADAGVSPEVVTSVAVTSQAQTFTLRTTEGKFLIPFISWQDTRAETLAAEMASDPFFKDFATHCSCHDLRGGQMLFLLKKVLSGRTAACDVQAVPLPSCFIEDLTGRLVLDEILAAMTGLYSLKHNKWHSPYLKWCGIKEQNLPEVCHTNTPAGTVRPGNLLGLPAGIPVFCAGNDQTAGAYAAELEKSGGILITLGSAQIAYQWVPEEPAPLPNTVRGVFPEKGFYRMIADSMGGNLITRATAQLDAKNFSVFFKLAQTGMDSHLALPELQVTPGEIIWKNASASSELKAASVVNFLCDRMAGFVRQLRKNQEPVFLTGGGTRHAVWRNCLSGKLGYELQLRQTSPDFGAARLIQNCLK